MFWHIQQSFTVYWCHIEHCYQAITSKCSIHTFTLSCHVLYVFTLVSLLVFTNLVQPFLLSQHFLLWCSFRKKQCLQETSVRLLPLFLWHLHLLCWFFCISGIFGFAMQFVLHIYIILDLYLFLAAPSLLQCVLGDSSLMITYQLLC